MGDALLTDMFKAQKTRLEATIYPMLEIISLCLEDSDICEYIYAQPSPTYQYTRYIDWFEPFATEQRDHLVESNQRFSYQDSQTKDNIDILTQIISLIPTLK